MRYSILINKCLTCPFEVRRKCPGNNDKRKQSRQSVPLLPTLPAFHLMSPAAEQQSPRVEWEESQLCRRFSPPLGPFCQTLPYSICHPCSLIPPPPLPLPPARCHQVPVLSGCLRFLSFSLAWHLLSLEAECVSSWCRRLFETA